MGSTPTRPNDSSLISQGKTDRLSSVTYLCPKGQTSILSQVYRFLFFTLNSYHSHEILYIWTILSQKLLAHQSWITQPSWNPELWYDEEHPISTTLLVRTGPSDLGFTAISFQSCHSGIINFLLNFIFRFFSPSVKQQQPQKYLFPPH